LRGNSSSAFRAFAYGKSLAELMPGKRNNFTMIRFVLASLVLFGHSFPIVGQGSDPISVSFLFPRTWLGQFAVALFFAISGFLIAKSATDSNLRDFLIKRFFRIMPALYFFLLISLFVIGPILNYGSIFEYSTASFNQIGWWTLLRPWEWNIPNAFMENPLPNSTNGSLWTIPLEILAYALMGLFLLLGLFGSRGITNLTLIIFGFANLNFHSYLPGFNFADRAIEPMTYFVIGALFYVNREKIQISWLGALLSAFFAVFFFTSSMSGVAVAIFCVYLLLVLTYKAPWINLDKLGDFSYGIYVWAWPVQQLVYSPGQSPYFNAAAAFAISLVCAVISWRLVERPSINLGRKLIKRRP
jgi:peptidoglycan/LPS O-acetylase OafA/YrhL